MELIMAEPNITNLSMTEDVKAQDSARHVASLPYVTDVIMLPDIHIKNNMEAPSSMIAATSGHIAPYLASGAINCGMGYIATGIDADKVSPEQLENILVKINSLAAKTKFTTTKYSWSEELLLDVLLKGAGPAIEYYGLDKSWLNNIENKGTSNIKDIKVDAIEKCVPDFLLSSKFTRSEVGLNFGGNHFFEIQAVDHIFDSSIVTEWGLSEGKLGIMYHLGPGPFGGNLLNLYESRKKPSLHRKLGYGFFRCLYQAMKGWDRWKNFGGFNNWMLLKEDSESAKTFETVVGVIDNYAYAYRMGTIKATVDVLEDVFGASYKDLGVRLVTDISHNILAQETYNGQNYWVTRHNCCRPRNGFAGIVAGSHRANSCISYGLEGCENFVCGYDHGVGKLLQNAESEGTIREDSRKLYSMKYTMYPGTTKVISNEKFGIYDTFLIDKVTGKLSDAGIISRAAYMRPLATLKMKY
jgi:RNA-splicing ligase RtcB